MSKWDDVRQQFRLRADRVHFATLQFASHPASVSKAIADYRDILDVEGHPYLRDHSKERRVEVLQALNDYFEVKVGFAGLTYSTTLGLGQLFAGTRIAPGQEILTSRNEHPATTETLQLLAHRARVPYRQFPLYRDSRTVSIKEILQNIAAEIRPWTRILTLNWVYSCDGVKLPVAEVAALVAAENARRVREDEQLLFILDGVHGFGIENATFPALGCHFFVAGCHKSLFGPRGTAVVCGTDAAWRHIVPLVGMLSSADEGPACRHVPGGVKTYEHWWALKEAFFFHLALSKADVEARIRQLTDLVKNELPRVAGLTIVTPRAAALSSGIVCFDLEGKTTDFVVAELERDGIIASASAPDMTAGHDHVRLAVSILNNESEVARLARSLERISQRSHA